MRKSQGWHNVASHLNALFHLNTDIITVGFRKYKKKILRSYMKPRSIFAASMLYNWDQSSKRTRWELQTWRSTQSAFDRGLVGWQIPWSNPLLTSKGVIKGDHRGVHAELLTAAFGRWLLWDTDQQSAICSKGTSYTHCLGDDLI